MLEIQQDEHNPGRRYCVGTVSSFDDIQSALDSVSTNFCLFLAVDATSISNEAIRKAAKPPSWKEGSLTFASGDRIVKECMINSTWLGILKNPFRKPYGTLRIARNLPNVSRPIAEIGLPYLSRMRHGHSRFESAY